MEPKNLQIRLMAKDAANVCHAVQAAEQIDKQTTAVMMSLLVELENFITHDAATYYIDPRKEMVVEWASKRERNT
jgi:hypothetical protein